jgi:hypothetical protein
MSMEARLVDNPTSEAGSRGFSVGGILADATLDVRGLWCPLPPLKTIRALGQMITVGCGCNPQTDRAGGDQGCGG